MPISLLQYAFLNIVNLYIPYSIPSSSIESIHTRNRRLTTIRNMERKSPRLFQSPQQTMNGNPRGLCSFEEATTRYPRSTSHYTLNLSIFLILIPTYLCKLFLQKKINVSPIHFHSPQNPTNGKASGSMSLRFLQCTFINL